MTTDEEAEFTALVHRQSRFVFRVAYAVLLNPHDAEDAVQEVFLKLYRNRGWRAVNDEQAFLARVAWRVAVDRRRSVRPSEPIGDPMSVLNPALDPPSPQPGPEETLVAANHQTLIHSMIDALPDDLRLPLVFSASQGLNSREIATILRIPEGTVRTRLQRARQILRQKLANLNRRDQEAQHA